MTLQNASNGALLSDEKLLFDVSESDRKLIRSFKNSFFFVFFINKSKAVNYPKLHLSSSVGNNACEATSPKDVYGFFA